MLQSAFKTLFAQVEAEVVVKMVLHFCAFRKADSRMLAERRPFLHPLMVLLDIVAWRKSNVDSGVLSLDAGAGRLYTRQPRLGLTKG